MLFIWYMAFHADLPATEIRFYQTLVLSPSLAFTIYSDALADRVGAGLIYVVSTSFFAAILISNGILDLRRGFIPEPFFLYCICSGIVSAISNPAIDTFIPEATDQPVGGNSLLMAVSVLFLQTHICQFFLQAKGDLGFANADISGQQQNLPTPSRTPSHRDRTSAISAVRPIVDVESCE